MMWIKFGREWADTGRVISILQLNAAFAGPSVQRPVDSVQPVACVHM